MTSESSLLVIRFGVRLAPQRYAETVLACQDVLGFLGLGDVATVWPDETASCADIDALSERWTAWSPWSN